MRDRPAVILVHGLWMNKYVLAPLGFSLRRQGFASHLFGYHSLRDGLAANAARLADFAAGLPTETVHFVGHSLGGLVILHALAEPGVARDGRVVLIGSPVRGSQVAGSLAGRRRGAWLVGASLREWNASPLGAWIGPTEVGIIAGSFRLGLATFFSRDLPSPNDGAVSVQETRLPGARHLTLPVSHTGMLLSPRVMRETGAFLRTGAFSGADD